MRRTCSGPWERRYMRPQKPHKSHSASGAGGGGRGSNTEAGFEEHLATNSYWDRQFDVQAMKVLPGEYFVSRDDIVMVTVLGSCVTACIRDNTLGIGGMNHFMLPDEGNRSGNSESARYGVYAMEILINHLIKMGARRNNLEAKVFGGGAVLHSLKTSDVGRRNAQFVMSFLQTESIPVVAKDLLDSYPRKVYYFPRNGKIMLKKLHRVHNDTLFDREREYSERLKVKPISGDVELFI